MRIRLAILDDDPGYAARFQSYVDAHYADKIELLVFTDAETALRALPDARANVLLVGDAYDVDLSRVPRRCGYAYFVESSNVDTYRGVRAIGKYSKIDQIYREVLEVFDDASESVQLRASGSGAGTRLVTFSSPAGGVGTTTAAVALCRLLALQDQRVLYLSLDPSGASDTLFSAAQESRGTFSDVIYALKRKRGNLSLQLAAHVLHDSYGTAYFGAPAHPADMLELTDEDVTYLLDQVVSAGAYDQVVVDVPFSARPSTLQLFDRSARVVLMSDGRPTANAKLVQGYQVLEMLDLRNETTMLPRACVVYNRFSSKGTERVRDFPVPELGGINRFEGATETQVVDAIAASGRLSTLLAEVLG